MIVLFLSLLFFPISTLASEIELIKGNSTISSPNTTFQLGFFTTNNQKWYLGIWYGSIPIPTYVWVANRASPVTSLPSAAAAITATGKLAVRDGATTVWQSDNADVATGVRVTEAGGLELLGGGEGERERVVWRSFDFPSDTWLPGMNLSGAQSLTCWRSARDPAPGNYSVRLRAPQYGEIELVYGENRSYWSTGNWIGDDFSGVPEMTIPYIYRFHFINPFTPDASFGYVETSLENGARPPLTRFQLVSSGQLRQYTWSSQTENWNMFWSQPETLCKVYKLCGDFGFCNSKKTLSPCECLAGFVPADGALWDSGDFSGGCIRQGGAVCSSSDGFEEIGDMSFDGAVIDTLYERRDTCEKSCLSNCSCIGLFCNSVTNMCKNVYGSVFNLRNSSSDTTNDGVLYLRVSRGSFPKKNEKNIISVLIVCVFSVLVMVTIVVVLILVKRKIEKKKQDEEEIFPVTNLKVFTYKELSVATRAFSDKLGHGGFGAVFSGQLSDSSMVAVKRLERPGGGEREFRAEVCTIGNIQHVNLVRLRGFCSENSHRLLVYDYMPNGPLSTYLKKDGPCLSWDVRFRVAMGTARALNYLHEGCRDCIIHCDIKPENILLDEGFSPKVSDFGLARLIGRDFSRVLATTRGTWGYVAPEWISGAGITPKADVYSYGMTMLELIGGRRNVVEEEERGGETMMREKWFFPPWAARRAIDGDMAAVVDGRLGGEYDVAEAERLGLVAVWCIQDDDVARPNMGTVVKMLEGLVEVAAPPPPRLIEALVSGESFCGVRVGSGKSAEISGGGFSNKMVKRNSENCIDKGNSEICIDHFTVEGNSGNCIDCVSKTS